MRSAGRIHSRLAELELFAGSLAADDVVALEATSGAGLIGEIIEPHVAKVMIANTRKLPQISKAKAKTDRLDARTLCRGSGEGALESRAVRGLAVRREHELHGLVEQRPQPGRDLLDRDAFRLSPRGSRARCPG